MKTIQTNTHLLLVDETNHGELNDWVTNGKDVTQINVLTVNDPNKHLCSKIIAAYPPINGIPEFQTLPPNTEDESNLHKLIELVESKIHNMFSFKTDIQKAFKPLYKFSSKQAKSETMFSLEDIKKAMEFVKENKSFQMHEQYLKSLTKPKEYEFIPEIESKKVNYVTPIWTPEGSYIAILPKIINNKIQGIWKLKTN